MPRPKKLRGEVTELRVRVGEDEREALRALSKAADVGVSEIVRRLILSAHVALLCGESGD